MRSQVGWVLSWNLAWDRVPRHPVQRVEALGLMDAIRTIDLIDVAWLGRNAIRGSGASL